jgi:hypothetical protein
MRFDDGIKNMEDNVMRFLLQEISYPGNMKFIIILKVFMKNGCFVYGPESFPPLRPKTGLHTLHC